MPPTSKENVMNLAITYGVYLAISATVTIWVAWTLHRRGRVFLVESFQGNEKLADSVNDLLVVGFYLINFGYVTLALKYGDKPANLQETIEFLATKVGLVLVILGGMHFVNLLGFSRMRKRRLPPPTSPFRSTVPPNFNRTLAGEPRPPFDTRT
jgi:hypothetical protein